MAEYSFSCSILDLVERFPVTSIRQSNSKYFRCLTQSSRRICSMFDLSFREWITAIVKAMASTGSDWVKEHHNDSFAPIRRDSQVQWLVKLSLPLVPFFPYQADGIFLSTCLPWPDSM